MTDEVKMVPVQEFNRLKDFYKGQMTENALLDKAGRSAAEEHLILKDKRIPDSMAVKMTKPIASEKGRLVKRLRTDKTGPLTFQGAEEPEGGMADAPVEALLKEIVKGVKKPQAARIIVEAGLSGIKVEPGPSGIKKEKKSPKIPIPSTPSTCKSGGWKKAALPGATKVLMKQIGVDPKVVDTFDTDVEGGRTTKEGTLLKAKVKPRNPKRSKRPTSKSYKVGNPGINPRNGKVWTMARTRT